MRNLSIGGVVLLLVPNVAWPAPTDEPKAVALQSAVRVEAAAATSVDDQKALRDLRLGTDGPALLDYFRKRTYPEANPREMAVLIHDLGDDEFATRERAYDRLVVLGAGALVGIKAAEKSKDPEVNRRADELRHRIETNAEPNIQAATARLIAKAKPAGAAQVLLNYVPFAADQAVTDEICRSLSAVAVVAGKVESCLLEALTDRVPVKRAAAGAALAGARVSDQLPNVRKLLRDADPTVRLRVALALLPLKEREVLPVLVDSLGCLNRDELWAAEEVLVRLAGDHAPAVSLGTTEATRKECRAAWQRWLDKEGKTADLAKLDEAQTMLGYTLIVQQNNNRLGGMRRGALCEVLEVDAAKKPRWKFDFASYAVEAQIVRVDGAERVLIAEYQGDRISERDFKGDIKWEKPVGGHPIGVQRLLGGNTFVVMQNRLLEMDRKGNEVFSMNRPTHDVFRARKLRNGDVVFVTQSGLCTRIDGKSQKVLKTFNVGQIPGLFGSIDVLPDGGVLIPDAQQNRVVEFNRDGRQVKTFNAAMPNSVMRLPNGNTLISSQQMRRILEFDRTGRPVWDYTADGMPFNARRR